MIFQFIFSLFNLLLFNSETRWSFMIPKKYGYLNGKIKCDKQKLNDENEKHFTRLNVQFQLNLFINYDLNENEFSNLTFDTITLTFTSINQIHRNVFGKTAKPY